MVKRKGKEVDSMLKMGEKIVKYRVPIFVLSLLLLIPSAIGYINTRINYDILYYLPDSIETMQVPLINSVGEARTFWMYGIIGIFCLFFTYRYLPETKGRSLEQIEKNWAEGVPARKF